MASSLHVSLENARNASIARKTIPKISSLSRKQTQCELDICLMPAFQDTSGIPVATLPAPRIMLLARKLEDLLAILEEVQVGTVSKGFKR